MKIITINLPITVSYETKFDIAGKVFAALLEKELSSNDISEELSGIVETAKVRTVEFLDKKLGALKKDIPF